MTKEELIEFNKENGYNCILTPISSTSGGGGISVKSIPYVIYNNIIVNGDLNGNITKYSDNSWHCSKDYDIVLGYGFSHVGSYFGYNDKYYYYYTINSIFQNNSILYNLEYFLKSPKNFLVHNTYGGGSVAPSSKLTSPIKNNKSKYSTATIVNLTSYFFNGNRYYDYMYLKVFDTPAFRPMFNI